MKSSLKWFDLYLMNSMIYGLLFGEKQTHFLKIPFHLEKNLKICKFVLINELYRIKFLMGKSRLESLHYCYLTTKNISGLKINTKEMDFQIRKFMSFLVHPTMHLPLIFSFLTLQMKIIYAT
jgi:hypothetical protein